MSETHWSGDLFCWVKSQLKFRLKWVRDFGKPKWSCSHELLHMCRVGNPYPCHSSSSTYNSYTQLHNEKRVWAYWGTWAVKSMTQFILIAKRKSEKSNNIKNNILREKCEQWRRANKCPIMPGHSVKTQHGRSSERMWLLRKHRMRRGLLL